MIYGASTQVKLSSQNELFSGNRAELWGLELDQTKSVKGRGRLNQSLFAEHKMKSQHTSFLSCHRDLIWSL